MGRKCARTGMGSKQMRQKGREKRPRARGVEYGDLTAGHVEKAGLSTRETPENKLKWQIEQTSQTISRKVCQKSTIINSKRVDMALPSGSENDPSSFCFSLWFFCFFLLFLS